MNSNSFSDPKSVRLLTLNCWGLPDMVTALVYRKMKRTKPTRTERMKLIGQEFVNFDIVCLQEMWMREDQLILQEMAKDAGLIYSHVYSSGLVNSSGLQILSRYPIIEVYFQKFRVNGNILRIDHGDNHAGKGVGFARIQFDKNHTICLFTTHTIAAYSANDVYHSDRLSQIWELARFIQLTTSKDDSLLLVTGDFNCGVHSLEYQTFLEISNLLDAYNVLNQDEGYTHEDLVHGKPKRLDYIFFRKNEKWELKDVQVTLTNHVKFYSDHFGVKATFQLGKTNEISSNFHKGDSLIQTYQKICQGIKVANSRKRFHIFRGISFLFLSIFMKIYFPYFVLDSGLLIIAIIELSIAFFIVENDVSALTQIAGEMKYFLPTSKRLELAVDSIDFHHSIT